VAENKEAPVLETLKTSFTKAKCPMGLGAIEIVSRSSRIAARIYVDNRNVYSIEISNFPLEVIRRVITSEHISQKHCDELLSLFSDNLNDAKISDYVLQNEMIPISALIVYLKDLFLGACDYIAMIPFAEVTWKSNVKSKSSPVPEIDLDRLWNVVDARKKDFQRIADIFGVGDFQIRNLKFKRVENSDIEITQLTANIYSLATGEWTILDFARQFGLSLYLSAREIQKLWIDHKIEVIYDNEFILKPPSLQVKEVVAVSPKPVKHAKPVVKKSSTVKDLSSNTETPKPNKELIDMQKQLIKLENEMNALKARIKKVQEEK